MACRVPGDIECLINELLQLQAQLGSWLAAAEPGIIPGAPLVLLSGENGCTVSEACWATVVRWSLSGGSSHCQTPLLCCPSGGHDVDYLLPGSAPGQLLKGPGSRVPLPRELPGIIPQEEAVPWGGLHCCWVVPPAAICCTTSGHGHVGHSAWWSSPFYLLISPCTTATAETLSSSSLGIQ